MGRAAGLAVGRRRRQRTRRQRDRCHAAIHVSANFTLDVVGELERACLREENAIG